MKRTAAMPSWEAVLTERGYAIPPVPPCTASFEGKRIDPNGLGFEVASASMLLETDDSEVAFQSALVLELRARGYILIICDNGGHMLNTQGCPDVWIAVPGKNHWVAIECKTATGSVRTEQEKLVVRGVSDIGRRITEVLSILKREFGDRAL